MKGFLYVGPGGYKTVRNLRAWVERGLEFVSSHTVENK
ncbi:MAG: hypothetical protein HW407_2289 [Bacteroidetes bacterium]|nr:hypothetical protein [Bacteroidota bacterium]